MIPFLTYFGVMAILYVLLVVAYKYGYVENRDLEGYTCGILYWPLLVFAALGVGLYMAIGWVFMLPFKWMDK